MKMKSHQASTKDESQDPNQTSVRKRLIMGSLIATFISITPYLFTLYESVPDTKSWNTMILYIFLLGF
jgi:hypothetical protein